MASNLVRFSVAIPEDLLDEFDAYAARRGTSANRSEAIRDVMREKLVEEASTDELFTHPLHPYTQVLLSAVPTPDPRTHRSRIVLDGELPSPLSPPSGCPFHTRCPRATEQCRAACPEFLELSSGHRVACHLSVSG